MRKLGLMLRVGPWLSVLLVLGACRSAPEPATVTVTTPGVAAPEPQPKTAVYDSSTTSIRAAVGESFIVALPAIIATPMRWRLDPVPDANVLSGAVEAYHDAPPADCAGCTGYPGTRTFELKALASGKVSLRFAYGSLTDAKAPPEKVVAIELVVQ